MAVRGIDRVVVATDDDRIADHAQAFGAEVVMTSSDAPQRHRTLRRGGGKAARLRRGREPAGRCAADPGLVCRGSGRGPAADPAADIATPVLRCDGRALAGFLADRRAGPRGRHDGGLRRRGPGALLLEGSDSLHRAATMPPDEPTPVFHHVGVYAYRPARSGGLSRLAHRPAGNAGRAGTVAVSGTGPPGPVRRGCRHAAASSGN